VILDISERLLFCSEHNISENGFLSAFRWTGEDALYPSQVCENEVDIIIGNLEIVMIFTHFAAGVETDPLSEAAY
jgi:hypothetical protein